VPTLPGRPHLPRQRCGAATPAAPSSGP